MTIRRTSVLAAIGLLIMAMFATAPAASAAEQSINVVEGDSGTTPLRIEIRASFAAQTFTPYTVVPGTATPGEDYIVTSASGTGGRIYCPIGPGCELMPITIISIVGDTVWEHNESFSVVSEGFDTVYINIPNDDFTGAPPQDATAPALTLPTDITAEATGPDGAVVSFTATASDLVDGEVGVDCVPGSGSTFAIGTTTVNCSATDASSNTASGSFNITVQDATAPLLTLPTDIVLDATELGGAAVSYTASAADIVDGTVSVDCVPASDQVFAVGTTTVECSATDMAGNQAYGSFLVTVRGAAEQINDEIGTIQGSTGIRAGFKDSLLGKLGEIQLSVADGVTIGACNQVNAYTNQIEAQYDKHIPWTEADLLLANAAQIRGALGCG